MEHSIMKSPITTTLLFISALTTSLVSSAASPTHQNQPAPHPAPAPASAQCTLLNANCKHSKSSCCGNMVCKNIAVNGGNLAMSRGMWICTKA
ncbi:Protein of unknown function [Pyronema omphalodes CBS 100304]|uniref:Uncharacterized protein n=1 Tax=Pyronema omphalodes (strain CBS 100304) TaxID=1076935 RepID=U4KVQ2_PYROM|nr:Protein of unknown function [Pyronema omphalodes CBS 100304]